MSSCATGLNGRCSPAILRCGDLPAAWADGMRGLLGIAPDNDRDGCLQDIHWYDGAWGYFPTYTLGAMIAAQLFEAVREAIPDVMETIAAASFSRSLRGCASMCTARARCCRPPNWSRARPVGRSALRVLSAICGSRYLDGRNEPP